MSSGSSARVWPADRSPRTIAHYAIHGRIGKGAMGVVFRAVDNRSGQPVALKVIASDFESDDEVRARFLREALVAGQLRHRNIVAVLGSGEDSGRLYLAMELLSGTTLAEFLKAQGAVDLEVRLDLMIQVCQGLMVAHEAGIYHRDIKPGNLFVGEDRRVKILDFGVARLAGSNMTVTGYVLGTPDYMSPEQARGYEVDERSDIFSAGAVFYLMLTGRKPFGADDLPAVLNKVLHENPLPLTPAEAPPLLAAAIHKALSKDPARRQQSVAQFASELMAAASAVAASTAQHAQGVRAIAEQLTALADRVRDRQLSLELPARPERAEWQALVEKYPMLRRGPRVLGSFPLRRSIVDAVENDLQAHLVTLRQEIEVLDQAHVEWSRGCAMIDGGQFTTAAAHLSAALQLAPESLAVAKAIEACGRAIAYQKEQHARFAAALERAEEAAGRQDWPAVLAITSEMEALVPHSANAERLRETANRSLDMERERVARERMSQEAASQVAEARALAQEQRFEEAITRLEAYLRASPNAPGVSEALDAIRREQEAARARRERKARRAEADRLVVEARSVRDGGDLTAAEQVAARATALDAEHEEARQLLADIQAAIALAKEREERARQVAELMERAMRLVERQNFDKALAALDRALSIDASHKQTTALRARIAAEAAEREAAEKAKALQQRRQRAAAPALREARRALAAGDIARARSAAEAALAQTPGSTEAQALIREIDSRLPPPSDDDTVRLNVSGDDQTARFAPAALRAMADQLWERAAALFRRWPTAKR